MVIPVVMDRYYGARLILLISDCDAEIENVRDLLTHLGFEVYVADSPEEASRFCELRRPAAIIADIEMAEGKGFSAVSAVRKTVYDCYVVASTRGQNEVLWPILSDVCGADDYVVGPLTVDKLTTTLPDDGHRPVRH